MALVLVVLAMLGAASGALARDCSSQPATGLCMASMPRYFYNTTSNQCEHFIYGGCGGNGNNYKTLAECEKSCLRLTLDDCSAEAEPGLCDALFHRVYFDVESGTCKDFVYGGCGGNKNNFGDVAECQDRCGQYARQDLTLEECSAEPETGMCRAYFPSYYFDAKTGKCESFVYGGCGGNANRFASAESCLQYCGKYASNLVPVSETEELCSQEPEVGPCRAAFPRYFWNHRLGVCQPFTYGGCRGNENNFGTSEQCHDTCKSTPVKGAECDAQPETGMCMAYIPSYFYNVTSGQCEKFIYGGCGGNGNRFNTFISCHSTCAQAIPVVDERLAVGICGAPKEVGPCRAAIPRYYYDVTSGSCEKFLYGGCGGNANNFETVDECHNTCLP